MNQIVSASEIIEKLNHGEDVYYEEDIIKGELDFTLVKSKSMELDLLYRVNIESSLIFIKCVFMDKVIAYRKDETGLITAVSFNEKVSFRGSTFKKGISFNYAVFNQKAPFHST